MKSARELAKEMEGLVDFMGNYLASWDFDIKKAEALILADRAEVRREVVKECRKALHDLPIWTPGTIDKALDAIAEGGEG